MAAAPVALLVAGTAMRALSSIQQGNAAAAQAKAQANAADYNAALARQGATMATNEAVARESQQRRQFDLLQGEAIAAAAQTGTMLDGSNADVLNQNALLAELDALTIRYEGATRARGLMAQSALATQEAAAARANASAAKTAGYVGAAAELIGGGTQYARFKRTKEL